MCQSDVDHQDNNLLHITKTIIINKNADTTFGKVEHFLENPPLPKYSPSFIANYIINYNPYDLKMPPLPTGKSSDQPPPPARLLQKEVKKTQLSLGTLITRPALQEQYLRRPPFRYLHDIVGSIIRETGFMRGVFDPAELNFDLISNNVDSKRLFLNKLIITAIEATGVSVEIRPSKILAGQEPEQTNKLLQLLAEGIRNEQASQRKQGQQWDKERGQIKLLAKATNQNRANNKVKGRKKAKVVQPSPPSLPLAKEGEGERRRESSAKDSGRALLGEETQSNDIHEDLLPLPCIECAECSNGGGETVSHPVQSQPQPQSPHKKMGKSGSDKVSSSPPPCKSSPDAGKLEFYRCCPDGSCPATDQHHNIFQDSLEIVEEHGLIPSTQTIEEKTLQEIRRLKSSIEIPLEQQEKDIAAVERCLGRGDGFICTVSPAGDAMRPPTCSTPQRPLSARRPPPQQIRASRNSAFSVIPLPFVLETNDATHPESWLTAPLPSFGFRPPEGKVANVIVELSSQSQSGKDDAFFDIQEVPMYEYLQPVPLDVPVPPTSEKFLGENNNPLAITAEDLKGLLVNQIASSQGEFNKDYFGTKKQDSHAEEESREQEQQRNRETYKAEISRLKEMIQEIAKNANPLGRFLCFEEDLHLIQKEFRHWQDENLRLDQDVERGRISVQKSLLPLKKSLEELENKIQSKKEDILATKLSVLKLESRITAILVGLDRVSEKPSSEEEEDLGEKMLLLPSSGEVLEMVGFTAPENSYADLPPPPPPAQDLQFLQRNVNMNRHPETETDDKSDLLLEQTRARAMMANDMDMYDFPKFRSKLKLPPEFPLKGNSSGIITAVLGPTVHADAEGGVDAGDKAEKDAGKVVKPEEDEELGPHHTEEYSYYS